jgi:hypothetical protein
MRLSVIARRCLREHIEAPRRSSHQCGPDRLGVNSGAATFTMFMPRPNAPIAARQITAVGPVQGHSTHHGQFSCAIAAYRNSWEALNFDMADDVGERSNGAPR